ncbi:MAG: YdbH domain-containing protein [Victivallaceae bacterium]|nr:YdbH domain-containing protein [Victivallaceae bacterium]
MIEKSEKTLRRRRRLRRWLTMLVVMALVLWFALPAAVERWVLPKAAAAMGFGYFTAKVRHIGPTSMDLSDVGIGSAPGSEQMNLSSVRVDFTPGFGGLTVDRITLSGVELDVAMDENGDFRIASKSLDELREKFTSDRKSGKSSIKVRSFKIDHGEIIFSTAQSRWRLPVTLELTMPEDEGCVMAGTFRIAQARDSLNGTFSYCEMKKSGAIELSAAVTTQRYLPLFAATRNLPLSGRIEGKLFCGFDLKEHSAAGSLSLSGDRLTYNDIAVELGEKLALSCKNGRVAAISSDGSVLKLTSPLFAADVSSLSIAADAALPFEADITAAADCSVMSAVRFDFLPQAKLRMGDNGLVFTATGPVSPRGIDGMVRGDRFDLTFDFWSAPQPRFSVNIGASGKAELALSRNGTAATLANPRLELSGAKRSEVWTMHGSFAADNASATLPGGMSGTADSLHGSWNGNDADKGNLLELSTGKLTAAAYGHRASAGGFSAVLSSPRGSTLALAVGNFAVTGLETDLGLPEIKKAEMDIDLVPPASGPAKARPWKVECGDGFAAAGTITATPAGWAIAGSGWKDTPGSGDPKLSATLDRAPNFQIFCHVELPETRIDSELLRRYFPKIKDWEIGGTLSGEAEYRYGLGNNRGFANVFLSGGSIRNPEAGIELQNIQCGLSLPNLPALSTVGPQRVTCEKIVYSGINMNKFHASFQLLSNEVLVDEAGLGVFGGELALYALRLRKNTSAVATTVFCNGIRLADFINAFGFAHAHGDGRVFGRLPVYWRNHKLFVRDGFLFSEPGIPESLRIADLQTGVDLSQAGAELDLAQEAMRDFIYNWVKISLNSEGEMLKIKATLSGAPAGNLPFTFDSGTGGFRRVDYRGAHFQGIDLVLNWSIPFNKFLELNELYGDLTQRIGK